MKKMPPDQSIRCTAAVLICLVCFLGACRKFVELPGPRTEVAASAVFETDAAATAAINGIYNRMMGSNLLLANGGITVFAGLSADELATTAPNPQYDPFFQNAIPADESITIWNRFWRWGYSHIYSANAVLEGVTASPSLSEDTRNQLWGEALFIRSFCYYYLTGLFGNVPLITVTAYNENAVLPRTPADSVLNRVFTDLQEAVRLLPDEYEGRARTRPNKGAAWSLLARVALTLGRWQEATNAAATVINSDQYKLEPDVSLVFNAGSKEAIWQLFPVAQSFNTAEGAVFIPSSARVRPPLALTPTLVAALQVGGGNRSSWAGVNTVSGISYHWPQKYRQRNGVEKLEYNTVLRLAEQYLIRAEALAQNGALPQALEDLNSIRRRAGLPDTVLVTKDAMLNAIWTERQIELFAEWGHRWFDLRRTGRATTVLQPLKTDWQPTDELYPIPFVEIQRNPALTQNPGY